MGYAGKVHLQLRAQELRKRGLSIKQIERELGISRSSASIWTREVVLTPEQFQQLYVNKKTGNLRGSMVAALKKRELTKRLVNRALLDARRLIGKISARDRFLTGISLYFGEGDKSGRNVAFTNSDPRAVRFMVDWFREFCSVSEDRFRCNLYLHDNLDERAAKKYWSKITRIAIDNFRKSYIIKNNPHRLRKTKHINGIIRITVSDAAMYRKIIGLISGVFGV